MKILPRPLTRESFAAYGDVIEMRGEPDFLINEGAAQRFHDLARIDVNESGGRAIVSMVKTRPVALPLDIKMMERHPLGSQIFMPLSKMPFLVVVSKNGTDDRPETPIAFIARSQGVNYGKNIWHHPLCALKETSDFLVVDRGGDGDNLEECFFKQQLYTIVMG